jgi:hypothetical protein
MLLFFYDFYKDIKNLIIYFQFQLIPHILKQHSVFSRFI